MSLLALYQCTHAEVASSMSASVRSGPLRNGEPSRTHSVLYKPMVVSARALSRASPTVPTEGVSPASSSVSVKCIAVYCDPASVLSRIRFKHDAGSQYTSVRFGETLSLSGLRPSVGTVGDAYDNALAETTIGLYKNECIRADSPFRRGLLRNLADVELITADYVAWYNQQRLMHRLGRVPPAEAEADYYSEHVTDRPAGSQNPEGA
jgi:transposase InsO family protein